MTCQVCHKPSEGFCGHPACPYEGTAPEPEVAITGKSKKKAASPLAGALATGAQDYGNDADAPKASQDTLAALRNLAAELLTKQRAVADAEAELAKAKDQLFDVEERRLPDMMKEYSVPSFTFTDTTTGITSIIKYESNWRVSMPALKDRQGNEHPGAAEKRKKIFEWLKAIGQAAIIDNDLEVSLKAATPEMRAELLSIMNDQFSTLEPTIVEGVNFNRLQALVRKMLKDGKNIDENLEVAPIHKASVKEK